MKAPNSTSPVITTNAKGVRITEEYYFGALICSICIMGELPKSIEFEIASFRKQPNSANPIARHWHSMVLKAGEYTETKKNYIEENFEFVQILKGFANS